MIAAGIDAGSRTVKVSLFDAESERVVGEHVADQGVHQRALARRAFDEALADAGLRAADVRAVVATGYGRDAIEFCDRTITEITCHARGVRHLHAEARTVVDIGGQDSKLLRLEHGGGVRDFVTNDRCAAGTGRFLEVVSERLGIPLADLGEAAAEADAPAAVSSMCVVFAETEIVSLLASGERPENIVAGVQASIATRIAAMGGRRIEEPVYFTGGVALVPGMAKALQAALDRCVRVCDRPQMTGALGAALLAAARAR
jgi:predicted CoA-substrate-specific enzyme activase